MEMGIVVKIHVRIHIFMPMPMSVSVLDVHVYVYMSNGACPRIHVVTQQGKDFLIFEFSLLMPMVRYHGPSNQGDLLSSFLQSSDEYILEILKCPLSFPGSFGPSSYCNSNFFQKCLYFYKTGQIFHNHHSYRAVLTLLYLVFLAFFVYETEFPQVFFYSTGGQFGTVILHVFYLFLTSGATKTTLFWKQLQKMAPCGEPSLFLPAGDCVWAKSYH
jgi:hypothetical protein